jgi:hypothetical protein
VSRLTKIIAPLLRERGLDVREVEGVTRDVRELVVTNPRFPHWGRIVIDREGLLEWDHWGDLDHDDGAEKLASVTLTILASAPGEDGDRYRRPCVPGDYDRPHP